MPGFLMLHHSFNNFEIQWNYQNKPRFNGIYSRDKLDKEKDEIYALNLDKYKSGGTHWIAVYVNDDKLTYHNSFGVEYILKEIRNKIKRQQQYYNKYL